MTGAITRVQGKRKTKVGRVVSDRMDKTIVVSVERLARHPLYKRVIRLTTKFKAHDETNDARVGDTVLIEESRPLSATKRWRLVSIIARAGEHGLPGESVVAEEAAVTEAIHAAAHPGRRSADDDGGESASGSEGRRGEAELSEDGGEAPASHPSEEEAVS
jgi:small subunit ribosomal protein S17